MNHVTFLKLVELITKVEISTVSEAKTRVRENSYSLEHDNFSSTRAKHSLQLQLTTNENGPVVNYCADLPIYISHFITSEYNAGSKDFETKMKQLLGIQDE